MSYYKCNKFKNNKNHLNRGFKHFFIDEYK